MADSVSLTWLGQAGFLIEYRRTRIVIDAYLSDSLHEKYRDSKFPHIRMMEIPVPPQKLTGLSFVLCTHGHTDHMDPGTLPVLADANPDCRFICPASERTKAVERGVPAGRFIGLDSGECFDDSSATGLKITAIASAHEELSVDGSGQSLFLGYVIEIGGRVMYHSGDCVPYDGLADSLGEFNIDTALLPVNGRDEVRKSNGVPGNFTAEEAVNLCFAAGIKTIVPHHFGMFDFNTAEPELIEKVLKNSGLEYIIPEAGVLFKPDK